MYAIVVSGGKQFKVSEGDIIEVEKIEKNIGEKLELDMILKVDGEKVLSGKEIEGVKAKAEVISQGKHKKIVVYKYKPKKNERKKQGHRQPFTRLKIAKIG